jgi:uracil-DNA glycosylase family 4
MATKEEQLEALAKAAEGCTACRLCEGRRTIVFGEGSAEARVMFVGEGPGREEDETGRPFVGAAGRLLTKILTAGGLSRDEVYITNVVKCRPPGNRNPADEEVAACERYLLAQIETIAPRIIVALGNVAKTFFLGANVGGITKVRGRVFPWAAGDLEVIPMYHPSYLLRNDTRSEGGPKWQTWQDMKTLTRRLQERGGL